MWPTGACPEIAQCMMLGVVNHGFDSNKCVDDVFKELLKRLDSKTNDLKGESSPRP